MSSPVLTIVEGMKLKNQNKTKISLVYILKAKVGEMEDITREGRSRRPVLRENVIFLVETDIFLHFRGLIFYNVKLLQFHIIKKQEHRGTVQKLLYSPIFSFFNWWSCCFRFCRTKNPLIAMDLLSFLMVAG